MKSALPIEEINGVPLTEEQKNYLGGFLTGIAQRGFQAGDFKSFATAQDAAPDAVVDVEDDAILEERLKRDLHPLDVYEQIIDNAVTNKAPSSDEVFRFKWNGLFFLSPVKNAFMARLRIPGGVLSAYQFRELARIANELTTGYVQITTRANLQMRLIEPKDAPDVLRRIQGIGLHTRGSGADNIRNITANPTAGVDPVELMDVSPFVHEIAQIIINDRSFYDLPRKFNIAYDGGGLIGVVEDTNDIGVKAVQTGDAGVAFRIAVGGATGHKGFARDLGVLVPPEIVTKVVVAITRTYIELGCRTDRKKARLKHLLEKMPLETFLTEVESRLGFQLCRSSVESEHVRWASQELKHSHIGVFPQKQEGLNYVGVALPVGQITCEQMLRIADLVEEFGGELRLTVWQNFIIPNVPDSKVPALKLALEEMGLATTQSNIASGVIACTGRKFCKFAQSDTKGHALDAIRYLESRVELDQPVNIHLTGCPNSCAQHYMGDIGCLGARTKVGTESVDAYHVFVGGGFGKYQALGRQVFTALAATELPSTLEHMLRVYMDQRVEAETFQQFTARHDLSELQSIFAR